MNYHIYILNSATAEKYYIGYIGDKILERLRKHNSNHAGFTGKYNNWEIIYSEIFTTKKEAILSEKEIKSWESKNKIISLINSSAGLEHSDV